MENITLHLELADFQKSIVSRHLSPSQQDTEINLARLDLSLQATQEGKLSDEELTKAVDTINEFEKGRKGEPIGTEKTWGGKKYKKTATGWKPVAEQSKQSPRKEAEKKSSSPNKDSTSKQSARSLKLIAHKGNQYAFKDKDARIVIYNKNEAQELGLNTDAATASDSQRAFYVGKNDSGEYVFFDPRGGISTYTKSEVQEEPKYKKLVDDYEESPFGQVEEQYREYVSGLGHNKERQKAQAIFSFLNESAEAMHQYDLGNLKQAARIHETALANLKANLEDAGVDVSNFKQDFEEFTDLFFVAETDFDDVMELVNTAKKEESSSEEPLMSKSAFSALKKAAQNQFDFDGWRKAVSVVYNDFKEKGIVEDRKQFREFFRELTMPNVIHGIEYSNILPYLQHNKENIERFDKSAAIEEIENLKIDQLWQVDKFLVRASSKEEAKALVKSKQGKASSTASSFSNKYINAFRDYPSAKSRRIHEGFKRLSMHMLGSEMNIEGYLLELKKQDPERYEKYIDLFPKKMNDVVEFYEKPHKVIWTPLR